MLLVVIFAKVQDYTELKRVVFVVLKSESIHTQKVVVGSTAIAKVDLVVLVVVILELGAQSEIVIFVIYVEPRVVFISLLFTVLR